MGRRTTMANIFNKGMDPNQENSKLENVIKFEKVLRKSGIIDSAGCKSDIYVKCPYTEKTCEYAPGEEMENRGYEILFLMRTRPRITREVGGVRKKLRLPNYKDLCETCEYTKFPGKSTKSFISENLITIPNQE